MDVLATSPNSAAHVKMRRMDDPRLASYSQVNPFPPPPPSRCQPERCVAGEILGGPGKRLVPEGKMGLTHRDIAKFALTQRQLEVFSYLFWCKRRPRQKTLLRNLSITNSTLRIDPITSTQWSGKALFSQPGAQPKSPSQSSPAASPCAMWQP